MKYCKNCKIKVDSDKDYCPLCFRELCRSIGGVGTQSETPGNGERSLPVEEKLHTGNSLIKKPVSFQRNGFRILQIIDGMDMILMLCGMMKKLP